MGTHTIEVEEITYCPQLRDTLLSVGALLQAGHTVNLSAAGGTFTDRMRTFTIPLKNQRNNFIADPDFSQQHARATQTSKREQDSEANVVTRAQQMNQEQQLQVPAAASSCPASNEPAPSASIGQQQDASASSSSNTTSDGLRHMRVMATLV